MTEQKWTPLAGLRRAGLHLGVRSTIALFVWSAVVWLVTPVLNLLIPHWAVFGVTALVMVAPGAAIGHGLSRNLNDIAGMAGVPVAALATAFG